VLACDHDPASVEATAAGALANGVDVSVLQCDLRREPGPWAPSVAANLVRPLLLDVARVMMRPPSRLIASGLLPGEVDEVVAAFARMREIRRVEGDGWAAVYLHSE
jgi:ribosomal protein L11 methylase PrmA